MASNGSRKRARQPAAAAGDANADDENPFDMLPDDLVLRILSELEATSAYTRRLWAVDKRFRRLLGSVEWRELRIHEAQGRLSASDALERPRKQAEFVRGMAERLRRGEMRGARRLVIRVASVYDCGLSPDNVAVLEFRNAVKDLIAALAGAATPLEQATFLPARAGNRFAHGDPGEYLASLLSDLRPCTALRTLTIECRLMWDALGRAPPQSFPPSVRELRAKSTRWTDFARMARLSPGLRSVHLQQLSTSDGLMAGLPECSQLAAVELVCNDSIWREEPLVLRRTAHSALLELPMLHTLAIGIDASSAPLLDGIAAAARLRTLKLRVEIEDVRTEPDEGISGGPLLRAAASALERATQLEELQLSVFSSTRTRGLDCGALAALVRAARPLLTQLAVECALPSAELIEEIAAGGPKLRRVYLRHPLRHPAAQPGLDALDAFSALARAPAGVRYQLAVLVRRELVGKARWALRRRVVPLPSPVRVAVEEL
eukprot:tig00020943_g16319.t1